jgi:hypothetical protein
MQMQANSSVQSTSSSKLFPTKLASSKPTAPSTASQPTQKKGGFGWFGSKKDAAAIPVAESATPAEVEYAHQSKPLTAAQLAEKTSQHKKEATVDTSDSSAPEDQENLKPSMMAHAAPLAASVAPAHKVLGEKQIDPAEYKSAAPSTPVAKGSAEGEYEPSPPREEYPINTK